jgi:hypothetical protein
LRSALWLDGIAGIDAQLFCPISAAQHQLGEITVQKMMMANKKKKIKLIKLYFDITFFFGDATTITQKKRVERNDRML